MSDEVERLRSLIGPSEKSYEDLAEDARHAREETQRAVSELGVLRGELAEMRVQLARARQDQDTMQRRAEMTAGEHLADLAGEAWSEVCRPLVVRAARRVRPAAPSRF